MTELKKIDVANLGLGTRALDILQEETEGYPTETCVLGQETVLDALADKSEDDFSKLIKAYLDDNNAEISRYLIVAINDCLIQWAENARDRGRQLEIKVRS